MLTDVLSQRVRTSGYKISISFRGEGSYLVPNVQICYLLSSSNENTPRN